MENKNYKSLIKSAYLDNAIVRIGKSCSTSFEMKCKEFAMYFNTEKRCFVIKSLSHYRQICGYKYKTSTLFFDRTIMNDDLNEYSIYYYEKAVSNNNSGPKETILVIGEAYYRDYIENPNVLKDIFDNIDDFKAKINEINDLENKGNYCNHSCSRDVINVLKKKRDNNFRKNVFKLAKNVSCTVCGCDIETLIDAAHIKGHEVERNNIKDDDPKYGVILCKIHHKMYDSGLLELGKDKKLLNYDEKISDNEWFKKYKKVDL